VAKRWLTFASLTALLTGAGAALFRQAESGRGAIIVAMLFSFVFVGTLWLFRQWYYRGSQLNARIWKQGIESEQRQWWLQHRQPFALQEIVLVGPAGGSETEWSRLFCRESLPPTEREERTGKALRIARMFSFDAEAREKQLARMLVLQWKEQGEGLARLSLRECYWAGSDTTWRAFVEQMKQSFPDITLPAEAKKWRGEETLAEIAGIFSEAAPETQVLVAGCQSHPASADMSRPAGESAVLWLAGAEGPALLTRGEIFEPSASETILQVCQRAQVQCELDGIPETCMLFSHPGQPELASSGWNVIQQIQDAYWGEQGEMEALVVISLAAIFARTQQQPCGWIATDPLHSLALGIVKPHG
jgi:hypothetical protein